MLKVAGKRLGIVADGFYAKRPMLKKLQGWDVTLVSRLRKDAALRDLPPTPKKSLHRGPDWPRKYGKKVAGSSPVVGGIAAIIPP
jgi:hypothetical protein